MGFYNFIYRIIRDFVCNKKMRHFFIICIIVVVLFLFISNNSSLGVAYVGEDSDAIQYTQEYIQKQLYYQAILTLQEYSENSTTSKSRVQTIIDQVNSGDYWVYSYIGSSSSCNGLTAYNGTSYASYFNASSYTYCYFWIVVLPYNYSSYTSYSTTAGYYNLYPSSSTAYTVNLYTFPENYTYLRTRTTLADGTSTWGYSTSSSTSVYLSTAYYGYMPDFFRDWCNSYGSSNADNIVESIEEQTESLDDAIQEQTDEITNSIDDQTQQQQEQYEEFTSEEYDENEVDDTFSDLSSISDDVDDTEYTGFFEALFDMFYDAFCNVGYYEEVSVAIPFTDQYLTFESDVIKNVILDTGLYTFIQLLYACLFGLWAFRFAYGVVCSIKDGSILNGDITSTGDEMLSELYGVKINQSAEKEVKK